MTKANRPDIGQMTADDVRIALAEALGWAHRRWDDGFFIGKYEGFENTVPDWTGETPDAFKSAHELGAEMERRGLADEYAVQLFNSVLNRNWLDPMSIYEDAIFGCAHATPLQRATAALRVLWDKEDEG